jgi:hypothetical protein
VNDVIDILSLQELSTEAYHPVLGLSTLSWSHCG